MSAALTLAREAKDPFAITYALLFDAWCATFRHDVEQTRRRADDALVIAQEHGLGLWIALGSIFQGWALALEADPAAGIAEVRGALAGMEAAGARMLRHFALALVAEGHWNGGEAEAALHAVDEALGEADSSGERFFQPELLRLRGEILARSGDTAAAEAALREAVNLARAQHAALLEERAARTLATLGVDA